MKILYCALFAFLLPVLAPKAQTVQSFGSAKIVEYQSPNDEDDFVLQKTTLVIRLPKKYLAGHSATDFSFVVRGEKSGDHSGKIIISDDGQTIIFQPDVPFSLDETVHATFSVKNDESFQPVSYQFTTTSMSETERSRALYELHQQWHAEEQEIMNNIIESPEGVPHSKGTDTIAFSPAVVVIDTITNHEDGNIFFAPMGIAAKKFSFLGITTDTASQAPADGNNFLFERDIPVGCGNFLLQPDGTTTYFQEFSAPGGGVFVGQVVHLDPNMKVIDTFQGANGYSADLHDFHIFRNHHTMLVAYDPQYVHMKKYLDTVESGAYHDVSLIAKDSAKVFGAIIQELDANKHVVFQWRSWDHFQIVDATIDIRLTDSVIDYMHINTADIDSLDGNVIASFRHCDEVSKINHANQSFVWRLGGKHNEFTFTGALNVKDTTPFSHQHDPARLGNGNLTLFDNGNLRIKDTTINGKDTIVNHPYSRALEYALDEANHTATVVWEYDSIPYCAAAGNVQRLDNGNTMIGLGITVQPSAIEVTPEGNKVFQMSIQKGTFSYRTYRFPFTPPLMSVQQTGSANSFALSGIYPNPASTGAKISFSVNAPGLMQIELLDILGHIVRTISERLPNSGSYTADLDVNNLPPGSYYCKLSQNGNQMVKMMVVGK